MTRARRPGRAGQIGLYCSSLEEIPGGLAGTGYYMRLSMGAAEIALAADFSLTLLPSLITPTQLEDLEVDGLIVADPSRDDAQVQRLEALGVAVVTCGRDPTPGAQHAGCVRTRHEPALRLLLNHLRDRGSDRIALINATVPTGWNLELSTTYDDWCFDNRLPPLTTLMPVSQSQEDIADAVDRLFDGLEPDAVVCALDGTAPLAIEALNERGLRVPDDVRVAACVDGPEMATAPIPVTAINLYPFEMGRQLASLLIQLLRGDTAPGQVQERDGGLTLRRSTA